MKDESIPPCPSAIPFQETIHGFRVEDRFRWLEDRTSSATQGFLDAEQAYYRNYLSQRSGLRLSLESRVRELLEIERVDLPVSDHRGGLIYNKQSAGEHQKAIYKSDPSGAERKLLSSIDVARDSRTSLSPLRISPEGRYLAYGLRRGGEDAQEIRIYDLVRHCSLSDRIRRGLFRGLVFDPNENGFYYVQEDGEGFDPSHPSLRYHLLGQQTEKEIFTLECDQATRLRVLASEDGSALGCSITWLAPELRSRFLIHPFPLRKDPIEIEVPRGATLAPQFSASRILAATNWCAPRGRIVWIPVEAHGPQDWAEIVPESDHSLRAFELHQGRLVVDYADGPRMRTSVYSMSGELVREIAYPQGGTATLGRVEPFRNCRFYAYSDILTGNSIFQVDLDTGQHSVWWRSPEVKWAVTPTIERSFYPASDGSSIPISIVRPSEMPQPTPTVLTVYGGRGAYDTPRFSVVLTVLVEAGFTYATTHPGAVNETAPRSRYLESAADALITAGRWLIANRYTPPAQLGIAGQSHGALVALCAMTRKPEDFRAAVALGPIADLTRFHLFGVARWFQQELGSPDNPEDFSGLLELSPYHRVAREISYPAVLIISGDLDKRCDAMHARKMIAALRESGSKRTIVLDYTEHRGHKPVLPLEDRVRSLTDRLTFLIAELSE